LQLFENQSIRFNIWHTKASFSGTRVHIFSRRNQQNLDKDKRTISEHISNIFK